MEWIEAEPGSLEIGPDQVRVWRFPLTDPHFRGAATRLTDAELDRANGMSSKKAAESFIATQSALREVLSAHTGTPPRDIALARGAHGKPMLASASHGIEFNVSNSGDWGLLAIARVAVGVDVERIRARRENSRFEQRFLTPRERALLRRRESTHGDSAFFVVWCRKEAYLKAAGFGLAAPFSRIDSAGDKLPDLDGNGNQLAGETPWSIMDFFVDDQHTGAVVARTAQMAPGFFTLRRPNR